MRKADLVRMLLEHRNRLITLGVELAELTTVMERIGLLDAVKCQLIQPWVEELDEKLSELEGVLTTYPAEQWRQAELLGMRLPELTKAKKLKERIMYLWRRERPGVIK